MPIHCRAHAHVPGGASARKLLPNPCSPVRQLLCGRGRAAVGQTVRAVSSDQVCRLARPASLPTRAMAATSSFGELGLSILGVGSEYPPYGLKPDEVQKLGEKYYPESPA